MGLGSPKRSNAANSSSNATTITTKVDVVGHFAPAVSEQENGRMEQIIFSDEVVTSVTAMM